jgi:3-hydroxyacyl-[acyl-carrier-protein] dehydratase
MRWWWIDKFTEFQSGKYAKTVKCVTLAEEQIDDYFPSYPVMPQSLIIEGLAQTGGLLVGQLSDFVRSVVLAKVSKAKFHFTASPGDQMVYTANLERIEAGGALVCCTVEVDDRRLADIELYFAYFDNRDIERGQFVPADFLRMMRVFKLFEVGVDAEGQPLKIPQRLLDAEKQSLEVAADQ